MSENASIAAALVEAQGYARALFKEAKNQHHRYAYASAEQVIDEARRALGRAGLALIQTSDRLNREGVTRGGDGLIGYVECSYTLVHKDGKSIDLSATMPVIVSKGRPDDKAYCAALTTCLAYFLRGLLLIPRDDDAAAIDQRDDRGFDPQAGMAALAERFIADMNHAESVEELEELRAAAKQELDPAHQSGVADAYKARMRSLQTRDQLRAAEEALEQRAATTSPQRQPEPNQPSHDGGERSAMADIESATAIHMLDPIAAWAQNAEEPTRTRVLVRAYQRLFELIDTPVELARHATMVRDAGLDEEAMRVLREAFTARQHALSGRAA